MGEEIKHPLAQFEDALKRLVKPAGDEPCFSSFELIKHNMEAFVLECHKTYKDLHYSSIAHQLALEKILGDSRFPKAAKVDIQYVKILWERINDTIVWQLFRQQRHQVKRLCMRQPRRPLAACNPTSVISALQKINSDPYKVAVWTDATGIVDIGDILCRDYKTGNVLFIEVKEGEVNEDIVRTIKTSACPWTVSDFLRRRGQKGREQMHRVIEQMKLNSQVTTFLEKEKGFDPTVGQDIEIIDISDVPDNDWDRELESVLRSSETDEGALTCVDNCLWLFAKNRTNESIRAPEQDFINRIEQLNGIAAKSMREYQNNDSFPCILHLQKWVKYVQSRPLFLRDITVDDMLLILKGKKHVMMFFDWAAFTDLLSQFGITLEWSSRKEGRREKSKARHERLLVIRDRMPRLKYGDAVIQLGDSHMLRLFFDGIRPSTLAAQFKRMCELMMQRIGKMPHPPQ